MEAENEKQRICFAIGIKNSSFPWRINLANKKDFSFNYS